MAHYSHGNWSGIKLTIGKRGIVFTRAPNSFNRCVAGKMRGESGSQSDIRQKFGSAAKAC